jgi:hypothetical protein
MPEARHHEPPKRTARLPEADHPLMPHINAGVLWRIGRWLLVVPVFGLHVGAMFLLYRGRVLTHSWPYDSDFVVFGIPTIIAFGLYLWVLWVRRPRLGWSVLAACLLTFFSWWAGMYACLNTYGS